MKEEKELKEIVIRQNSGIVFPKNEGVNGDILILGNFNGICGEVTWHGVGAADNSFVDNNFYNFESTFVTNISVLMDTLRAGNRIFIVGSRETISYFKNLLYTIADTFMCDMPAKKCKTMFNKQVWTIDTTELYERTFVKYNSTSKYRKEAADKAIHDIVTNKIFEKIQHMKFDYIIQNPPYNGSLHLDFLEKGLDLLTEKGKMVIIEPATWLINVRKYGKRGENGRTCSSEIKKYDKIKDRLKGHVESVTIENRNKDFCTDQFVPFATMVVDFSKQYNEIKFVCFGEEKSVKSLYDCNLIGDYSTIWSIFNKVLGFGKMMKEHIYHPGKSCDINETFFVGYVRDSQFPICQLETKRVGRNYDKSENLWVKTKNGYVHSRFISPVLSYLDSEVVNTPYKKRDQGKKITDKIGDNLYGTKQELENWKYFVLNNKLPMFLSFCFIYDMHLNNLDDFMPWLVDKKYTDEEINQMFGFNQDEIAMIDRTINKYERNSQWFRRYICGPGQ